MSNTDITQDFKKRLEQALTAVINTPTNQLKKQIKARCKANKSTKSLTTKTTNHE